MIRKGYVDTSGGQLHYREVAGPSGDAPLVFFHRTPVSSRSFEQVMLALAGWRRTLAFDTPGFGGSYTPEDDTPIESFTRAFREALAATGVTRCHLIGHHTGAHFAAEIAAQAPEMVLSLMIDGAMVTTAAERAGSGPSPDPVIDRDGSYARAAWEFLLPYHSVFEGRVIHEDYVGALASMFTRGACMKAIRAHDMVAVLARVRCPVLATAACDDVFLAHLERIRAVCPDAALRIYAEAGIAAPELRSDEFAALVREAVAMAGD
jgi:pimeloyl-ACP methyl ester carboxylesterase